MLLALGIGVGGLSWGGEPRAPWVAAGPLFQTFPLALEPGDGVEALGPLFYRREGEDETLWAVPPVVSVLRSDDGERVQVLVLPPLFTWRRYGEDMRWQLVQWINGSRLERIDEDREVRRFNLFPFWFYQDAPDPEQDYWALFPFYGTLRNRMFRDEAEFVLFPLWLKTRKGTMTTRNVLFPVVHTREGPGLRGWQVWPLVGHERRAPGVRTNVVDEIEVVPGHDKTFALWPVFFRNRLGLGTESPARVDAALPLFYAERSPARDHTSVLWPLVSWTENREERFRQWNAPWPLVGFARGEGKTLDRVIPFFSVGRTETFESESYLWPLYRRRHLMTESIDRDRRQWAVFLYVDLREQNLETGRTARRIDSWPLFSWSRSPEGVERWQGLSVMEPLRRGAGIERNWSPVWGLWRGEHDGRTGKGNRSILWNVYRRDYEAAMSRTSFLFGLVQCERTVAGRRWKWFHFGSRHGGGAATEERASDVPDDR